jgi:aminopeptidase YwaD
MRLAPSIVVRIESDNELWADFNRLCDCGGRLAGTEGERRAFAVIGELGEKATGVAGRSIPVSYGGWRALSTTLRLPDGSAALCHPLVRTIATPQGGLSAEVVDVGRGTPEEFEAHVDDIGGRVVMVRHEPMFAAGTIHRRRKYEMARRAGAVGFLIVSPLADGLVAGSSGREGDDGIPAVGISQDTARRLQRTSRGWPRATLDITTEEQPARTETLLFDIPGEIDECVVLSAHVDGHSLAESAMDNASGLAAALSVARALAAGADGGRGLRLAFFSVEEWALTGSAQYVSGLSEAERSKIVLNVNLDSVAGSPNLAALTSGFAQIEPFLLRVAEANDRRLRLVRPLMMNSDHANFALAGIPALRLVAGFDEPSANLRYVLTPQDTRDKVRDHELRQAAILAAGIVGAALQAPSSETAAWRQTKSAPV